MNVKYVSKTHYSLVLLVLLALVNCVAQDNSKMSIDDLLDHFSNDFEVTITAFPIFQMIGAMDGRKVDLNRVGVEIYKFDIKDRSRKKMLDEITETGTSSVFMMSSSPMFVNGSFVLIIHEFGSVLSEREEVLNRFMEF